MIVHVQNSELFGDEDETPRKLGGGIVFHWCSRYWKNPKMKLWLVNYYTGLSLVQYQRV